MLIVVLWLVAIVLLEGSRGRLEAEEARRQEALRRGAERNRVDLECAVGPPEDRS